MKINKKLKEKFYLWAIVLVLAGLQAWQNRYNLLTGDAVVYLDMGEAFLKGDWNSAIVSYFAPVYPLILTLFQSIFRPSSFWEFFVVKVTNVFLLIVSIFAFDLFLNEFIKHYNKKLSLLNSNQNIFLKIPDWIWNIFGYCLFIWASIGWSGVQMDTPDAYVSIIIYLASFLTLRIYHNPENWVNFVLLGSILGIGVMVKSFMVIMSLSYLVTIVIIMIIQKKISIPKILTTIFLLCIVASPYIVAISAKTGKFSYGSSGSLNYAWFVSPGGILQEYWKGNVQRSDDANSSIQKVVNNPTVLKFSEPLIGTYSPWHDPPSWNPDTTPSFNLELQIKAIWRNLVFYYRNYGVYLLFGYLTLIFLVVKNRNFLQDLFDNWPILIPAIWGLSIYALILAEPRYVSFLILLLFTGVYGSIFLPNILEIKKLVLGLASSLLTITILCQLINVWPSQTEHLNWKIAGEMNQLGIKPGDKIAILGSYREGSRYFWARLAKLKIVAEIPSLDQFWQADEAERQKIYDILKQTGAKVLVEKPGESTFLDYKTVQGWQKLKDIDGYLYFLNSET